MTPRQILARLDLDGLAFEGAETQRMVNKMTEIAESILGRAQDTDAALLAALWLCHHGMTDMEVHWKSRPKRRPT